MSDLLQQLVTRHHKNFFFNVIYCIRRPRSWSLDYMRFKRLYNIFKICQEEVSRTFNHTSAFISRKRLTIKQLVLVFYEFKKNGIRSKIQIRHCDLRKGIFGYNNEEKRAAQIKNHEKCFLIYTLPWCHDFKKKSIK